MATFTRRRFLNHGATAAVSLTVLGGCDDPASRRAGPTTAGGGPTYAAGTRADYPADGPYDARAAKAAGGFIIVRAGVRLYALSSACTHLGCPLAAENGQLVCGCHGSRFAADGRRLAGPAKRPLDRFAIYGEPDGDGLIVDTARRFGMGQWEDPAAYAFVT